MEYNIEGPEIDVIDSYHIIYLMPSRWNIRLHLRLFGEAFFDTGIDQHCKWHLKLELYMPQEKLMTCLDKIPEVID